MIGCALVLIVALVVAVPVVYWVDRMTDQAIDECLRKIRMHQ